MNQLAIEVASRQAWPALVEKQLAYGVLRFAHGASRRVNSLNVFVNTKVDPGEICAAAESYFGGHGLPAIVRVVRSVAALESHRKLDRHLSRQQYRRVAPTHVMQCCIAVSRPATLDRSCFAVEHVDLPRWLASWQNILDKADSELQIYQKILQRLMYPHCFLVRRDFSGRAVCCAMAVFSSGQLGIFGVATSPVYRGNGHATALVKQLLLWGESIGATAAYLQVETSNKSAISVYEKLGFENLYQYWYREKHNHTANSKGEYEHNCN